LAFVGDAAVEGQGVGGGGRDGDMELEIHGEGEANDIKAGTDIGGGAGSPDCKFGVGHGGGGAPSGGVVVRRGDRAIESELADYECLMNKWNVYMSCLCQLAIPEEVGSRLTLCAIQELRSYVTV